MAFKTPFDREKHVFHSPELQNLMLDAIRFFNGTPVHSLPPEERFLGSGVYAIYYTGKNKLYKRLGEINRISHKLPIYIGKAIPQGGRRGIHTLKGDENSLYKRLNEHKNSILQAIKFNESHGVNDDFLLEDFACRFIIIPVDESALISPIEAALIKQYTPLWNSVIDGFGNHAPGSGRYNQAKSAWDSLHRGRSWAEKCKGMAPSIDSINENIKLYFDKLKTNNLDEIS